MYSDTLDMDFSFDVPGRRPALLSRKMFDVPVRPMEAKGLIGYLDVRRLASRILGTWRRCGVMDNVSYVQGPAQVLVIIHHLHISTASPSKGWGV